MMIDEEFCGKRLDLAVAEIYEISRSSAQKMIDSGFVTVNGKREKKNYVMKADDELIFDPPEPVLPEAVPQDIPLDIVYEDGDIIIVNKKKGMVVHPAPGNPDNTLVNALLFHCKGSLSGINGVLRPGIVHRIDKDTSGLLMVAKNDSAHKFLAEQIKDHSFEREYETIVVGNVKNDDGTVDAPIGRSRKDRKKMAVVPEGRNAVTHYRIVERYDGFTRLRICLETGRTHQIRVHMAYIGYPVLGDQVYGRSLTPFEKKHAGVLNGQCLHAKVLGFVHPDGRRMRFESELPDYFNTVIDLLR